MAFLVPLIESMPLPVVGFSIERAVMDWKVEPSPHQFKKAKEVAAFANHLGGTVLVGANEDRATGQLQGYAWMTLKKAKEACSAYSTAVAQRCLPLPRFEFEQWAHPVDAEKRVVAINVWPSLNLVGVRVKSDPNEGWEESTFAYPVRSGIDARYLQPHEFAMHMTPGVRRIAVLLSRIPTGTFVGVAIGERLVGQRVQWRFVEVLEEENLVKFSDADGAPRHIPLDRIVTVFLDEKGTWRVVSEVFH